MKEIIIQKLIVNLNLAKLITINAIPLKIKVDIQKKLKIQII